MSLTDEMVKELSKEIKSAQAERKFWSKETPKNQFTTDLEGLQLMKLRLYMFAYDQHQRRRDKKLNLAWLVNLFYKNNPDYCLEVWVERTLSSKRVT